MTELAVLPSLERASGLRNLAARMRMSLELRIDSARHGKSLLESSGRKARGREWMARSVEGLLVIYVLNSGSLGARSNLIQMS